MATVATKPVTADEFWEFVNQPENRGKRFELVQGEIVEKPSPGKYHGFVCGNVTAMLWTFARTRKRGYVCSNDSGVIVAENPDTVRGPDVCYFDDAPTPTDMDRGFAQRPPLLVVEVLSPSDRHNATRIRVQQYLNRGVALVWVVDPEARDVTSERRGRDTLQAVGDGELTGEDVLPELRVRLSELFTLPGQAG
jgi:Uma2 family endonuclease